MSDISMCQNTECEDRLECYRFCATPNKYAQSYTTFEPDEGESRCGMFWQMEREE